MELLQKKELEFQTKLTRNRSLQTYEEYITFLKTSRKTVRAQGGDMKEWLKKIESVFKEALTYFPSDFNLYLNHFKFCNNITTAETLLKKFPEKPETYKEVTNYYKNVQNSVKALDVISEGIDKHKQSKLLYLECIKLIMGSNKWSEQEQESKIKFSIDQAFLYIKDYKFYVEVLEILRDSFAKFHESIINKLLKLDSDVAEIWHFLAQREKHGYRNKIINDEIKTCVERCLATYDKGLQLIELRPMETKEKLWNYKLDTLLEFRNNLYINSEHLKEALKTASEKIVLKEKYFLVWLVVENDPKVLDNIIKNGALSHPNSLAQLCKYRMKTAIERNNPQEIIVALKSSISILPPDNTTALELWLLAFRYFCLFSSNFKIVENMYNDGIKQTEHPTLSNVLKSKYLEWLVQFRGLIKAREAYEWISLLEPYCKDLHCTMADIEVLQLVSDNRATQKVWELACKQFPKDMDVWVRYLDFCKCILKDKVHISRVYKEALEKLSVYDRDTFQEKCAKLEVI